MTVDMEYVESLDYDPFKNIRETVPAFAEKSPRDLDELKALREALPDDPRVLNSLLFTEWQRGERLETFQPAPDADPIELPSPNTTTNADPNMSPSNSPTPIHAQNCNCDCAHSDPNMSDSILPNSTREQYINYLANHELTTNDRSDWAGLEDRRLENAVKYVAHQERITKLEETVKNARGEPVSHTRDAPSPPATGQEARANANDAGSADVEKWESLVTKASGIAREE